MFALLKLPRSLCLPTNSAERPSHSAERRVFPRRELSSSVQGIRVDHSLSALKQPQLSLSLRDISVGGLSAVSPLELEKGERLSIMFPPETGRMGWDAYGRVIRCEPSGMGYRVALQFDLLQAA